MFQARREEFEQVPEAGSWVAVTRKREYHPCKAILACPKCAVPHVIGLADHEDKPRYFECERCSFKDDVILDGIELPPVGWLEPISGVGPAGGDIAWWTYQGGDLGWTRTQMKPIDPGQTATETRAQMSDPPLDDASWYAKYPIMTDANQWVTNNRWQAIDGGFGHTQQKTTSNVGD